MRIALLADVHANLPALRAVTEDIRASGARTCVCAGDVVGFGPHPKACVDAVRSMCQVVVAGNHDRAVGAGEDPRCAPELAAAVAASMDLARRQLETADLAWLRGLGHEQSLYLHGQVLFAVHGSPTDPLHRGITADVDPQRLAMEFMTVDADFIVLGHTHRPMVLRDVVESAVLINPGSVGMPLDGDPRASYALLDTEDGTVHLRRLPYDVSSVIEDLGHLARADRDLFASMLAKGARL